VVNSITGNVDSLLNGLALITTAIFIIYTVTRFVLWVLNEGFVIALLRLFSYRLLLPFLLVVGINLLSMAVVFVLPQQVGVVVSAVSPGGIRPLPLRGGFHLIVPFVENVELYPLSWQTYTMSAGFTEGEEIGDDSIRARTSDGQEVFLDTSVIFRVNVDQAVLIHVDWQDRYIEEFVRPLIRGNVRTQVSQFKVAEVNSSARKDLEATLERLLRDEFALKGLILDQFLVRDIGFSPEYAAAIEAKQVALEDQAKASFQAEQVRRLAQGEADAILINAQAQSAGLKLIAEALEQNPQLVTYEYVQKLSPGIQVMLVPSDNPFLLPLPELGSQSAITATNTVTPTTRLPNPSAGNNAP
jgi:regulator of protease activity HflC (stomatin/prohibitin superfamily)